MLSFVSNKAEYFHLNYWNIVTESLSLKYFIHYFLTIECSHGCNELIKINVSNIVKICNVRVNEF